MRSRPLWQVGNLLPAIEPAQDFGHDTALVEFLMPVMADLADAAVAEMTALWAELRSLKSNKRRMDARVNRIAAW